MLMFSLVAVAACGGKDGPTGNDFTHIGTWNLARVGDKTVPVTASATACGGAVESGSLVLRENGTYSLRVKYGPAPCLSEYVGDGSYTIANDRDITLAVAGAPIRMAYFGFIIDWMNAGVRYEFTK